MFNAVTFWFNDAQLSVAEPLLHYYENQEELLLYLNKIVTNANPTRKLDDAKIILLLKK